MALKVVGVRLVADDGATYIATLARAETAEEKLAKGAKTAADGLTFMERAAKGAAERVGHLATDALADAGRAVLKFAVDGVRAAGDFESGMNNFASVVGNSLDGSGQSLNDFKDLFISLGRDLPVSTSEVQQAAIEMAKGGIEPATIAAGGLKQTLQFAAAGGLDLASAATIAAKTIGGWADVNATADEKAQLLAHSTDLLARAANASTVDVHELALGLYNVQGTARSTGASLDETVTTLALLAPNFNSSAEAGNAMKNMLLRLQPATAPAAKAMADLGLLTKDGNSAFYDAEGHFIGMRATADKLQKALGNLSQAQRTEALRTIFGNDALNAANTLLMQGADGYDRMTQSLAKQMGVAEQAKLKQQGFNTAVDNLMGSLEALQITVGTGVLPLLTRLLGTLASGVNAITEYASATMEGKTVLAEIASTISTLALPAIYGLTAATIAYGVTALAPMLVNIPAMTAVLIYNTQAFIANAAAVALAALPYAAIGAAIAVVILKYQQFNETVTTATDKLLESRQWWMDAGTALENYGAQSGDAATKLAPLAANIENFRNVIHGEVEDLGKREASYQVAVDMYNRFGAASGITAEQLAATRAALDADLATVNKHNEGLIVATKAYNDEAQSIIDAQAATMTATAESERLRAGTEELGAQASLTADDIEAFGKKIQDTYQKGADAVQGYATNQSSFLAGVEQRQQDHAAKIEELEQKKNKATTEDQKQAIDDQIKQAEEGYREQEQAAATSYVNQQKAQQQHLGQMLIDYTVAQASLGNINKDKAAEITDALTKAYGLQESSVASTFLRMAGSIDTFAKDAGGDVNDLTRTLHDQQQQAAETQRAMDGYAKTYTANAVANFVERKGQADDYIKSLEAIPTEVSSAMQLPDVDDRIDEIKDINRGIAQIPRHVTIKIDVEDNVPPEYKPGSPTPFEIGIRGIIDAVADLQLQTANGILGGVGDDAAGILDIFNQINNVIADIYDTQADMLRQQEKNLSDLDQYSTTEQAKIQGQLDQAQQEADQIEDPEEAKKYYAMRSKQIFELADLDKERQEAIAGSADKIKEQTSGLDDQIAALQEQRKLAVDPAQQQQLDKMIFVLQNRRQRIIDQITADATKRIDQQIALLKQAQAAEQAAFEQRANAQSGLAEDIQSILDAWGNLTEEGGLEINDDTPPEVAAFINELYHLIAQLSNLDFAAEGGPLDVMQPYVVGERGPELIVPGASSYALAAEQTRRMMTPMAMGSATSYGGTTINLGGITINGSGLGESALRNAIFGAVNDAARASDLRIRTGVA